jgi:hypothetical protein
MPIYNNTNPPYSVAPGEETTGVSNPVNAEQLGAGSPFSQRVAIADVHGFPPRPVTVTFTYASAPASVQYDIYGAWDDTSPLTSYTKISSTTSVTGDQVTLQRAAAGGPNFRFLCVREVISPGVNATVKVQQ